MKYGDIINVIASKCVVNRARDLFNSCLPVYVKMKDGTLIQIAGLSRFISENKKSYIALKPAVKEEVIDFTMLHFNNCIGCLSSKLQNEVVRFHPLNKKCAYRINDIELTSEMLILKI